MKNVFRWFTILSLACASTSALAASHSNRTPSSGGSGGGGGTGIGLVFGSPTGVTAKFMRGADPAFDLGVAYSFDQFLLVYGDALWHFRGAISGAPGLTPYVGIGAEAIFGDRWYEWNGKWRTSSFSSVGFGIRIPVGMEWRLPKPPIGIFVELVPGLGLVPGMFGFFQGGIGARFYF